MDDLAVANPEEQRALAVEKDQAVADFQLREAAEDGAFGRAADVATEDDVAGGAEVGRAEVEADDAWVRLGWEMPAAPAAVSAAGAE